MDEINLFDAAPLTPMQRIAADFRAALEGTGLGYDTSMIKTETVTPKSSKPYERIYIETVDGEGKIQTQNLFRDCKKGYVRCPPIAAKELERVGLQLEPVSATGSNNWKRLPIAALDFTAYPGAAQEIFEAVLRRNGYGCCSRYLECSDAKRCVHPDIMFAVQCAYRKNLMAGHIFYGKNANVK
ncbi:MAG: hypothetical protein LUC48_11335 [Clostridiales bacterium]|nr:hypothetical protein [Clostridiales bacterium]